MLKHEIFPPESISMVLVCLSEWTSITGGCNPSWVKMHCTFDGAVKYSQQHARVNYVKLDDIYENLLKGYNSSLNQA